MLELGQDLTEIIEHIIWYTTILHGDMVKYDPVCFRRIPFGDHPLKLERYGED